jgi:hypothetical protein
MGESAMNWDKEDKPSSVKNKHNLGGENDIRDRRAIRAKLNSRISSGTLKCDTGAGTANF